MFKKIVIVITFVLAICLGIFLFLNTKAEQTEAEKYDQENEELRPLLVKKSEMEQRIKELDDAYEASKHPKATTQVIYTGLEQEVYSICYPIVEEFEYTGILALAWNQLPGMDGCMSLEQFQELIGKGWEICIKWDVQTPVDTWWPQIEKFFKEQSLEMTKIVYFVTDAYNSQLDEVLQSKGFEIVYHHGEDGKPLIQTTEEDGLWHLGAVGLMGEKPKLRLKEAVAQTGNITYLVGFELEDEKYDERSFKAMLSYFDSYEANQELLVLNTQNTRQHYRDRLIGHETERDEEYKQQRAALVEELEKIKTQIEKAKE